MQLDDRPVEAVDHWDLLARRRRLDRCHRILDLRVIHPIAEGDDVRVLLARRGVEEVPVREERVLLDRRVAAVHVVPPVPLAVHVVPLQREVEHGDQVLRRLAVGVVQVLERRELSRPDTLLLRASPREAQRAVRHAVGVGLEEVGVAVHGQVYEARVLRRVVRARAVDRRVDGRRRAAVGRRQVVRVLEVDQVTVPRLLVLESALPHIVIPTRVLAGKHERHGVPLIEEQAALVAVPVPFEGELRVAARALNLEEDVLVPLHLHLEGTARQNLDHIAWLILEHVAARAAQ
mmetsp:Transcript_56878/g.130619  ORF Transcript_56878/g.130619 Transcript_56878/m.130619 type:complete len:291 (+) Transcript_56878:1763-2635(+)